MAFTTSPKKNLFLEITTVIPCIEDTNIKVGSYDGEFQSVRCH